MFVGYFEVVQAEIAAISLHDGGALILVDSIGEHLLASAGARESEPSHDAIDVDERFHALHGLVDDVLESLHLSGVEGVGIAADDGDADRAKGGRRIVVDAIDDGASLTSRSSFALERRRDGRDV